MARDLRLGRILLPTIHDDLTEALGDQLETVGASLVAGERRPRPFSVSIPIHGLAGDTDPYEVALTARRQLRSLVENPIARSQGLWFAFAADPELDGWLLVGSADLEYGDGGITLGEFKLTLGDCYRVASPRTHRLARHLEVYDRRLATVPRDYLSKLYSTDFAAQTAEVRHYLPVGATDVVGAAGRVVVPATRASNEGAVPYVVGATPFETVTFEQAAADRHKGDVVVRDRPASGVFEEAYGPDFPLTAADVPTVENGVCRLRYEKAVQAFALDAYVVGTGYVEQGRVSFWIDGPAGTEVRCDTFVSSQVVEWTPERSVVLAVLKVAATGARCSVYITLQRGWSGPRVEAYADDTGAAAPGVAVRLVPSTAGATTLGRSSGTVAVVDGTDYGTLAALEPWLYLLPAAPNLALHLAALQGGPKIVGRSDTASYGAARLGVSFSSQLGGAAAGYVSATLGVGARGAEAADAQNLGRTNLYDAQAVPELVAR